MLSYTLSSSFSTPSSTFIYIFIYPLIILILPFLSLNFDSFLSCIFFFFLSILLTYPLSSFPLSPPLLPYFATLMSCFPTSLKLIYTPIHLLFFLTSFLHLLFLYRILSHFSLFLAFPRCFLPSCYTSPQLTQPLLYLPPLPYSSFSIPR